MLDMDAAKLPPPIPESSAINWNTQNGVFDPAKPDRFQLRVASTNWWLKNGVAATTQTNKKLAGMRSVAPVKPAIAARLNKSPA